MFRVVILLEDEIARNSERIGAGSEIVFEDIVGVESDIIHKYDRVSGSTTYTLLNALSQLSVFSRACSDSSSQMSSRSWRSRLARDI